MALPARLAALLIHAAVEREADARAALLARRGVGRDRRGAARRVLRSAGPAAATRGVSALAAGGATTLSAGSGPAAGASVMTDAEGAEGAGAAAVAGSTGADAGATAAAAGLAGPVAAPRPRAGCAARCR